MATKKGLIFISLYAITGFIIWSLFFFTPVESNSYPLLRIFIISFASILLTKYFVYMLIAPWHDVRIAMRSYQKRYPLVSILIPAYNEGAGVLSTVKTILASTYKNVEVIVINDGSKDNSDKLMRAFVKEYNSRSIDGVKQKIAVRYFYKENGGKGKALNFGIEKAKGDIIMTIDADCVLTPTTVGNFVRSFDNPKVMAAVGNVKIANTETMVGVVQYLEFLFSFYFKKAESVLGMIYIIGGAAGAFRKEVFSRVGMFDHTTITEDIELTVRIQKAGMKVVYASDAIVYTEGASDLGGLMKQRLRWKKGLFETLGKHRDLLFSTSRKHNMPLCWFLLPLTYFGNVQLGLELFFLAFLYIYSFMTSDFASFISGIVIVFSMFIIIMFFEGQDDYTYKTFGRFGFFALAPIGWLIFYLSTVVEFQALTRALWCTARGKKVTWQAWQRVGITAQIT
jgi:biofilm PGA synthesis N-glycosyltransferase PgaC